MHLDQNFCSSGRAARKHVNDFVSLKLDVNNYRSERRRCKHGGLPITCRYSTWRCVR